MIMTSHRTLPAIDAGVPPRRRILARLSTRQHKRRTGSLIGVNWDAEDRHPAHWSLGRTPWRLQRPHTSGAMVYQRQSTATVPSFRRRARFSACHRRLWPVADAQLADARTLASGRRAKQVRNLPTPQAID